MKTHDLPYAIGAFILNVQVDLVGRGLMTREGHVPDMKAFKDALVSSIKKPITIRMSLTGTAAMVDYAVINSGTRFVGD